VPSGKKHLIGVSVMEDLIPHRLGLDWSFFSRNILFILLFLYVIFLLSFFLSKATKIAFFEHLPKTILKFCHNTSREIDEQSHNAAFSVN